MSLETILILGSGHLANRTKSLLIKRGYDVNHLPNIFDNLPSADPSTIAETENIFGELNMESFKMIYVLFEKDEDNLEIVIAMMRSFSNVPIATSLFNENLRAHLERANPKLIILNPAKLAAFAFVEEIDSPNKREKNSISPPPILPKNPKNVSFFLLISTFFLFVFLAVVYFHSSEHLSWIDAFYFVSVTISTVGYGDISFAGSDSLSKMMVILLILGSSIFIWIIYYSLLDNLVKRKEQNAMGRKRYRYKNHIILCGLGRLGYFIANQLYENGEKIIIIESNKESVNIEYFRNKNVDVYIGNARLSDVLQDVGAAHCRALISVIDNDYGNLEIGLNARYFQPDVRLVLRIFDESMAEVIKEKFDIHRTKSMSFLAAEKFAELITPNQTSHKT